MMPELSDREWRDYLLKYAGQFRVFRDSDGCVYIRARLGKIGTFSIRNARLFYTTQMLTKRKKSAFLAVISRSLQGEFEAYQNFDFELSIHFAEADLDSFIPFLKPYRKPVLTCEERQRRRDRMLNFKKPCRGLKAAEE